MWRYVPEDRFYLAGPSRGNVRVSINKFTELWLRFALVIRKPGFKLPEEYQGMNTKRFRSMIGFRSISPITEMNNAIVEFNYCNMKYCRPWQPDGPSIH